MSENPATKAGYNLIFHDDFTGFDAGVWDKSSPGDDNCAYNSGAFCASGNYDCQAPKNESNVLGSDGDNLLIQLREGEDHDLCAHSSGEVKTFDGLVGSSFPDWEIDPNSFLEIRVRFPECYDAGIGCAGWLWHYSNEDKYSEIDIWEVYGDEANSYQSNFHFGEGSGGNCSTLALWFENLIFSCHELDEIKVRDLQGQGFDLSEHFLTFGVEWDYNGIKYWLNNEETKFVGLNNFPYKRVHPYRLRLGTGKSLHAEITDCPSLPDQMAVDYVRVYKKAGFRAVRKKSDEILTLCAGDVGTGLYLSYYPNTSYTVSIPTSAALAGQPGLCYAGVIAEPDRMAWWVLANPGTPVGIYTISIQITFPSGYQETVVQQVNVTSGAPAAPIGFSMATDGDCFYTPVIAIEANTSGYDWRINGGSWVRFPNQPGAIYNYGKPIKAGPHSATHTICVRAYSGCGTSSGTCQQVVLPACGGNCSNCLVMPIPPREIEVAQIGNSEQYTLKVRRTLTATAYQWSYDRHDWYQVNNTENESYNTFGSHAAGSPPLPMYVRAVFPHDTSEVYSQEVSFPPATELLIAPENTRQAALPDEPASDRAYLGSDSPGPVGYFLVIDWSGRTVTRLDGPEPDLAALRRQGAPSGIYVLAAYSANGRPLSQRKIFLTDQN